MDHEDGILVVNDQRFYVFDEVEPQTVFYNLVLSLIKRAIVLDVIALHESIFVGDDVHHGKRCFGVLSQQSCLGDDEPLPC